MSSSSDNEVERLQARVRELERQLKASKKAAAQPAPGDRSKVVTGVLAGTTALMAVPAFITVRRWVLWWR